MSRESDTGYFRFLLAHVSFSEIPWFWWAGSNFIASLYQDCDNNSFRSSLFPFFLGVLKYPEQLFLSIQSFTASKNEKFNRLRIITMVTMNVVYLLCESDIKNLHQRLNIRGCCTPTRRATGNFRGQGSRPQKGHNINLIWRGYSLELYSSDLETEKYYRNLPNFATFKSNDNKHFHRTRTEIQ